MALRATSQLVPTPSSTRRPVNASFSFAVTVVDRRAPKAKPRTLELALAASNDLSFADGQKTVTQEVSVGSEPVDVTFPSEGISGPGNLAAFEVTLRENGGSRIVSCMIALE